MERRVEQDIKFIVEDFAKRYGNPKEKDAPGENKKLNLLHQMYLKKLALEYHVGGVKVSTRLADAITKNTSLDEMYKKLEEDFEDVAQNNMNDALKVGRLINALKKKMR